MTSSAWKRFAVITYSPFVVLSGNIGKILMTGYLLMLQSMDQQAVLDLLHSLFLSDHSLLFGYKLYEFLEQKTLKKLYERMVLLLHASFHLIQSCSQLEYSLTINTQAEWACQLCPYYLQQQLSKLVKESSINANSPRVRSGEVQQPEAMY